MAFVAMTSFMPELGDIDVVDFNGQRHGANVIGA
jgi:hypothetical protein